ncbi:MAG: hypothetical protein GTO02_02515, partial [Candidatus Dadabacteria bacterium]|nr:hypothetical protein [Candidatus Dadabacteria bacterium]
MTSKYVKLKPNEVKHLGLKPKHHNGYSLGEDKLRQLYIYRGFDEAIIDECIDKGIRPEKVNYYWYKSEKFSINAKGSEDTSLIQQLEEILDNVILKHSNERKIKNDVNVPLKDKKALKVTISDSHVGMNPNLNSGSLFQYEYNAKVYKESMLKVHQSILKEFATHGTFEILFLDDLGDMADGWNGYTTRGGHELPQNMTNAEVFETCLDAKIEMIDRLVADNIANKIVLRCVVNDNHSGDFSLIINKAIKKLIELKYSNKLVEVDILERFIEHRIYGNHCFLLTHGKDKA